jgi:NifU-like protein involved in Fe-S cluster formation
MRTDEIVDRGLHCPLYAECLPGATHTGDGRNDSCGDHVQFDFEINGGVITKARHTCKACVLTTAMADFVCEALEGQTPDFVSTIDPFKMIGIAIGPNRRECITVVIRAAAKALNVPVHL